MDDTIFISQSKYVKNIMKKFGLESASHKRTPTTTHLKLTKDEKGVDVDQSLYMSMISSILYLTTSRPYIIFAVGVCASSNSMIIVYCDAYWTCKADDRKSTSGGCFFLGNNLISWFNKKQNYVSLSTAEAEYIAVGSSCSQLI
ncbi:uncharacterized mitochondrial protein AtMg00810-like [Lathyrus oleraceus]|uniref:uncharacterized mitochondrial protein AtMg00810-like n=1 Tax=Pisum sativum TaxID=3888 RepID=UPI0021D0E9E2|nr:uncharacterized mitochondrial protein AtMg00810-like [Pisum sativum]